VRHVGTLLCAGVAALAMGLVWREQRSVDGLRRDVAALSSSQARVLEKPETIVIEHERLVVREATPVTGSIASPASSPAASAEPAPISDAQLSASISGRFDAEVRDTGWADRAASEIERAVAATKADGVRLEAIECRASLCRMKAWFASAGAERAAMDRLLVGRDAQLRMGGMQLTDVVEEPDGSTTAAMWILRGEAAGATAR
jgi:hypothetical protein